MRSGLTLSTIKIPTAHRHESLQLPARTFDTIGKDTDVTCVATTSNGSEIVRVVFGSVDGKVFFIEPAITSTENDNDADSNDADSSRSLVPFQGPESEVTSLVFSPDNTKLLVSWKSACKVMAFDVEDGSKLYECQAPHSLYGCAFSKDGKRVVIGGIYGWKMFEFDNFPEKIESDELASVLEGAATSATFSGDDTKLAVGVAGGDARGCYIYNADGTEDVLDIFCKGEYVYKVAFSPNSMILAVGNFGKVHLFNVVTGECLHTFQIMGTCSDIEYSNDGHQIFFSAYNNSGTGMLYGYDVYSGTLQFKIRSDKQVFGFALLNDKTLLAACRDDNCKLINIAARPTHQVRHEKDIYGSAVSRNGELIVFAYGFQGGFKVYKTSNNKLVSKNSEVTTSAFAVCFSSSGNKIACVGGKNMINIYNVANGTKERTIATPDDFLKSQIEFLENEQHIIRFNKDGGGKAAYVIKIDSREEDPLSITTSTEILDAGIVPQKELLAIATGEEISFHNVTDGYINNAISYKLNNKQDGTFQAMQFTSDGSRMVLCSDTHVHTYNFHSDLGVDSSSKFSTLLQQGEADLVASRLMTISGDDKVVAVCDSNQHIHTFILGNGGSERDVVVHKCPTHTGIRRMHFLPRSSSEGNYPLVLSYGGEKVEATTTLEVTAKEGRVIDPSLLLRSLDVCKDKFMLNLVIPKHKDLLYRRDENGRTLAEHAVEQGRPDVLRMILRVDPFLAWISFIVLVYLLETTDETMIELITIGYKCAFPIDLAILEKLIERILKLAENGSADTICYFLEAGASNCSGGFVSGDTTYLKAFRNFDPFGSLLLDNSKPCDGSRIIPEASSSSNERKMYDRFEEDKKKRIQLIIARVLLPWLSSYKVLNALIDMDLSSGEEGEGSSIIPQHLKPFQCQSLRSSIEAAWYSWARTMFLRRALCYVLYMVCIMLLECTTTIPWLRVSVIAAICILWCYFFSLETHQFYDKTLFRYMYDFWNIWQMLSLVLVFIYVCLNIVDIFISDTTRTTLFSQHEWFPGLVHLFTLINFMYYLRGIQKTSWKLYALGVLIKKIWHFVLILLWILISASFQLAKVNGAFDSKKPIHIFTETYVTAIFGAFESAEFCSDPYIEASRVVLTLFIILSLFFMIFMNAMIAFISEEFANILNYQKAILAREMAILIVDLYSSMSEEDMNIMKENYKWVYKLFKQTDFNKTEFGDTESDADGGRRATKQDVQSVVAKVRKEMNTSLARMEIEIAVLKSNIDVIKKESGDIKKENAEIKSSLERMEEESKAALETIISLVSSTRTS